MKDNPYNYKFKFDNKVIFLVGNIGSGKSTYINGLKDHYIVCSRDKIRYMLGNGNYIFDKVLEPAVWQGELALYTNLTKIGVNIVIDEVNANPNMRQRYLEVTPPSYEKTAIIMPYLTKEESVNRRMQNPHGISLRGEWENVWERFNGIYEPPTIEEGFDKIINLGEMI